MRSQKTRDDIITKNKINKGSDHVLKCFREVEMISNVKYNLKIKKCLKGDNRPLSQGADNVQWQRRGIIKLVNYVMMQSQIFVKNKKNITFLNHHW